MLQRFGSFLKRLWLSALTVFGDILIDGGSLYISSTAAGETPWRFFGYSNANSVWGIGAQASQSYFLGDSVDYDRAVEWRYTPGATGAKAGELWFGQINKNNANFTHGNTRFYVNGLDRFSIDVNGRIYSAYSHNNAGGLDGSVPCFGSQSEAKYTPTWVSSLNLAATPTSTTQRVIRAGNNVIVTGAVTLDPTAAGVCVFTQTLPIASNLSSDTYLLGGWCGEGGANNGVVAGDNGNPGKANFSYNAPSGAVVTVPYFYMYEVK